MIYIDDTVLDREFEDLPMPSQAMIILMKLLSNKEYCSTMDNFYNSSVSIDKK